MLVDPHGRPVSVASLKREQATPASGRSAKLVDLDGMSPERLRKIFTAQDKGEIDELVAYASTVERVDGHIGAQLAMRSLAVAALPWKVETVDDNPESERIAEEVRALIARPAWQDLVIGLQDAVLGPYAAIEILWDTSSKQWMPKGYESRDLRWLRTVDGVPHLRAADGQGVEALNPYGWAIHRLRRYRGAITRDGLARGLCALRCIKSLGVRAWLQFAEIFGVPTRVVRYPRGATPAEKQDYEAMARDLGLDSWAAIPVGADVSISEPASISENDFHERLCSWSDSQASKLIVMQTMTADDGSSRSQSETHKSMFAMVTASDARRAAATAKRDVIDPYLALNYGPGKGDLIKVSIDVSEPIPLADMIGAVCELVDRGAEVGVSQLLDLLRLVRPGKDEQTLKPLRSAAQAPAVA